MVKLAVCFMIALSGAAAVGVGKLVGPVDTLEAADHASMDESYEETGEAHGTSSDEAASAPVDVPKGLMVSQNGYTLELGRTDAPAGSAVPPGAVTPSRPSRIAAMARASRSSAVAARAGPPRDASPPPRTAPTMWGARTSPSVAIAAMLTATCSGDASMSP